MGTSVQVSPGFEKGMGLLWRAAVAAELESYGPPPPVITQQFLLHMRFYIQEK